ncbi:NAD(P)H-hydrate dehydratase [Leifsonia sp. Leaf336]|uniref:NAD(P)H-hydrate dehydratase n=1 Tax=Leifsonia sp. Leaf336 TaxID=1736341 RepID=UPI0009EAB8EB|nr:NAD(P)H-hydrate dehydratase [Leifsonia sp. Leaf336]
MPTPERITPGFLRAWPLPDPGGSKYARGQVLVVGGSRRSPGAALLSGRAALRVGAGRLTLAVGASTAVATAVALPECGVVPLPESRGGSVRGSGLRASAADLAGADAVLAGPGLDHAGETAKMLRLLGRLTSPGATLVLDAYALGALAGHPRLAGRGRRILTPNTEEAQRLLGRRLRDRDADTLAIARRYGAVVSCFGRIASPDGRLLTVGDGVPGLGTSGSGDALSGAIAGLAARGCEPLQAAAWGTYLHVAAGVSLSKSLAPLGFLASEIVDRLAVEVVAVGQ